MTTVIEALKSVQFVVDQHGQPTAVILDIASWDALIEWIETTADTQMAIRELEDLSKAGGRPEQAGWLNWDDIREEWDAEEEASSEPL